MYAMYASGWPMPVHDLADDRRLAMLAAIREARLVEEPIGDELHRERGLLERVRRALGLAQSEPECITCPA